MTIKRHFSYYVMSSKFIGPNSKQNIPYSGNNQTHLCCMITIQTRAIHASVWLPYRWLLPASQKMGRCCMSFLLPSQEWPKWLFLQVSFWMWPAHTVSLTRGAWEFVLLWLSTFCMVFKHFACMCFLSLVCYFTKYTLNLLSDYESGASHTTFSVGQKP